MNILVTDLDKNISLDSAAMIGLTGGWRNAGRTVCFSGESSSGWSNWLQCGRPFTMKRYRKICRIKTVKIKQVKREWDFKKVCGCSF